METRFVYDNYEISPCRRYEEPDSPGRFYFEVCQPSEADVWTLYGHIDGQGVEAIGDFSSREASEQVFYRITGQPFTGSYQACPRLRLLHAAPALLSALEAFIAADALAEACGEWKWENLGHAFKLARAAIAEATAACPPWVTADLDVHALLAKRRQIAAIWSVEDVQAVRPDLTDEQAWEVLQQAGRRHDAEAGINWDVLGGHVDMLHGDAPDGDEPEEE